MSKRKDELLDGITKELISTKFVGNNTLEIEYKDGSKAYRLHNTDVVTIKPNGDYVLNTDGWRTSTSKDRINKYIPANVRVYQENSVWFISTSNYWGDDKKKEIYFYYDGITLNSEGKIISELKEDPRPEVKRIKRNIAKFVKLIDDFEELPKPDNGDCWDCAFKTKEGQTMGDISGTNTHLKDHMKEGYITGSLLVNTMTETGYTHDQISMHYHLKINDTFKRAVRKYLNKRLLRDLI